VTVRRVRTGAKWLGPDEDEGPSSKRGGRYVTWEDGDIEVVRRGNDDGDEGRYPCSSVTNVRAGEYLCWSRSLFFLDFLFYLVKLFYNIPA
jgi:hypothetical protein